jgi:hypothetical protein
VFIVELEPNVYIAPWQGDPGRTVIKQHAQQYYTEHGAKTALGIARKFRLFHRGRVINLEESN